MALLNLGDAYKLHQKFIGSFEHPFDAEDFNNEIDDQLAQKPTND